MNVSQGRVSWIRVHGVVMPPSEAEDPAAARARIAALLPVEEHRLAEVRLERRSLDARARPPRFEHRFLCRLEPGTRLRLPIHRGSLRVEGADPPREDPAPPRRAFPPGFRPVVVGAGPAGLWAALTLARLGAPPLLVERGRAVEERGPAVNRHWREGVLDPENNVLFGEGGAGTFSDGKIYTRIRDPRAARVLRDLHELGAPVGILVDGRPHIGTDRLKVVLMRLRRLLADLGVEVRFGTRAEGLVVEGGRLTRLRLSGGEEVPAPAVVLAPGHSARDTFRWLRALGVPMEARPTAIGVRIEHSQALIDRIQYGCVREEAGLPPSDYHLACDAGRGRPRRVWSFCMCPGGKVISASNEVGLQVTNGMSYSKRAAGFGNAGLIAQVPVEDYDPHGAPDDPLRGLRFQEVWERRAWEAAGGGFVAPVQRAADLLAGRPTEDEEILGSYLPGMRGTDLSSCLPAPVLESLKGALRVFDARMPGFAGREALLVGVESRTSSPVRIVRGADLQCPGFEGLYPVGEGAGYAGGIVSAAVDGVSAAEAIAAARALQGMAPAGGDP
ncbi:hypothetical protein L6R50_17780 [Myxococcota bacterium]|nr:hypothetical protein [Myxococcota bacterium]